MEYRSVREPCLRNVAENWTCERWRRSRALLAEVRDRLRATTCLHDNFLLMLTRKPGFLCARFQLAQVCAQKGVVGHLRAISIDRHRAPVLFQ